MCFGVFLFPAVAKYELCSQVTAGLNAQHKQLILMAFSGTVH